jgi:hypothetical protein
MEWRIPSRPLTPAGFIEPCNVRIVLAQKENPAQGQAGFSSRTAGWIRGATAVLAVVELMPRKVHLVRALY